MRRWSNLVERQYDQTQMICGCAGSFDSQLPRLIETLRFALLHKNKRTFADASSRREDW